MSTFSVKFELLMILYTGSKIIIQIQEQYAMPKGILGFRGNMEASSLVFHAK